MEREVKIYIGNASRFEKKNLYIVPGYFVSDEGEVYNGTTKLKEYIRKGYKYVYLPINGKKKLCKVHRIVATTYQDICGDFNEVVNHLDENRLNNRAANLRWTTNKENLTWGNIREKQSEAKQRNSILRNLVLNIYQEVGLSPDVDLTITELKSCYKIYDNTNGMKFYTSGKKNVIDEKRGDYYYVTNTLRYNLFADGAFKDTELNKTGTFRYPFVPDEFYIQFFLS